MRRSTPAIGDAVQAIDAAWTATRREKSVLISMMRAPVWHSPLPVPRADAAASGAASASDGEPAGRNQAGQPRFQGPVVGGRSLPANRIPSGANRDPCCYEPQGAGRHDLVGKLLHKLLDRSSS